MSEETLLSYETVSPETPNSGPEALPALVAAQGAMLAHLRHELRTPLNQIIGYGELLIEEAEDKGQHDFVPDLNRILSASKNLHNLINDTFGGPQPKAVVQTMAAGSRPAAEARDEAEGLAGRRISESERRTGNLLVVDDNETNRDLLGRRLERQGYTVTQAESGTDALRMIEDGDFDLVLLDIMMPEMDGYEVLARLKGDPRWRHLPVIMISALDEMVSVVRCIQMGAEDYLPKPFNPVLLRARVGACLEKKRMRDREIALYEQLQENYRRLQDLERLRDDLTHMIVHDLRTPLTSIITGLQTLEMIGTLDPTQSEFVQMAVSGGGTLLNMINDLLDVGKLEDGSLKLERDDVDVDELAAWSLQQVAWLAKDKDLTLVRDVEPGLPRVAADRDKLRRTLVNLLGNAIKFTPNGGTVTLSAGLDREDGCVRFGVRDTGEGIPGEAFERIFEKFGQVENRKAGRKMSTGLGLTFCKLAVEAHGGRIWVESELGQGSVFQFTVPCER